MTEWHNIKIIHQVEAEGGHGLVRSTNEVNAYLKKGWQLLSIGERGYDHTAIQEEARFVTVFVLGNTVTNATRPSQDPLSKRWS